VSLFCAAIKDTTGGSSIKNMNLFLTDLETGELKIKVPTDPESDESCCLLLHWVLTWQKMEG
jgi:hypothetical protein